MIPSLASMVLTTHAAFMRRRVALGVPFVSSALFLAGYLLAWSGFSAVAALVRSLLYRSALLEGTRCRSVRGQAAQS
jgi:predicted metal-binding membrane protein